MAVTQPSDRARKAAEAIEATGLLKGDEARDAARAVLATFERETPGFAAGVEATEIYGWRSRDGTVYSGEGYPVPLRKFILDSQNAVALFVKPSLTPAPPASEFQPGVDKWMDACFGEPIKSDQLERADRFTEEALELAQTMPGFTAERAHALVDYVFGRDVGERHQEVGGVMVTLAALCNTVGLDIAEEGDRELARIWTKVEKIRAKQAAKPTGSALPVAPPASEGLDTDALERWADIRDDPDAIVACGERWKVVARGIGCSLHGFNDGRSASFTTPDGNTIEVGAKFRAALSAIRPTLDAARDLLPVSAMSDMTKALLGIHTPTLDAEIAALRHDLERQMNIAHEAVNAIDAERVAWEGEVADWLDESYSIRCAQVCHGSVAEMIADAIRSGAYRSETNAE